MPKVSILSPTYNHEKYVGEAISSMLSQTFADFELIIADDASADCTVEKILQFADSRITLLRNEYNQGTTATSKRCWQQSTGEYIMALSTDDIYEPDMIEILSKHLDENPHSLAVFGLASYIDDDGSPLQQSWTGVGVGQDRFTHLRQLFFLQHPFCSIAGMFRRTTFEKFGYFPPYLRQTDDMAHFIKILFHGEMPILPNKVLRYRWQANKGNVSARTPENDSRLDFELFEVLDLFREHLQSINLLCKIFPEVKQHPWPLDDDLTAFHLAHLSIDFNYMSHRLYGMHLLYQLLKNEQMANNLRQRCNFHYTDFFRLAGKYPLVMSYALCNDNGKLNAENIRLKQNIEELKSALQTARSNEIVHKIKKRLRFIKPWLAALK